MTPLVSNGHFNVLVRDHDSEVTGFGKHDRVLATFPKGNEMYMRVDHKWRLGMPTEKQLLALARKQTGLRGRWRLDRTEPWERNGTAHTDVYFMREVK